MIIFLLPLLAIAIGIVLTILFLKSDSKSFKLLLTFSGAFLLSTTVFELLPELYHQFKPKLVGVFILLGIILQIILEFFSKGAEHGHLHNNSKGVMSFPWLLFISVFIHAFLEGIPIAHHQTIVYGVFVHKIPVAALISAYLIKAKVSRAKIFLFLLMFALMTPLGTLVSGSSTIEDNFVIGLNAIVTGMFFHISTIILFETDKGHQFNLGKLLAISIAVGVAYFL